MPAGFLLHPTVGATPLFFLDPLGLLALLSLVPLVLLYIFQPDPRRVEIPTMGFLPTPEEEGSSVPVVDYVRRNPLLFLQLTVLLLLSLSIASPYLPVGGSQAAESTVVVVDASASMATGDGDSRFDRAVDAARADVSGDTTVVVARDSPSVELRDGSTAEAVAVLDGLSVADVEADLRSALSQAYAAAGSGSRILVYSDFAGADDWRLPVEEARADDVPVVLNQFAGGGDDNVGFVDASVAGATATLSLHNYGDSAVDRTVTLGERSVEVTVPPRSRTQASFEVPAGGGVVESAPGDDFSTDDSAYLAAHPDGALDVLLVTSEGGGVEAALESTAGVELTVQPPPATSFDAGDYDVVVYHDVDLDRLVGRNARDTREVVEAGGGAVFTAQPDLEEIDGGFDPVLAVEPGPPVDGGGVTSVRNHSLVSRYELPAPTEVLEADVVGDAPVSSAGQPLFAERQVGGGRTVFLGYLSRSSDFDASYLYPLFWRDLVHYVADRPTVAEANRRTGDTVDFGDADVSTPSGEASGEVSLDHAGLYSTSGVTYSANLYDVEESDVAAESVEQSEAAEAARRSQKANLPLDLTPFVAVLALAAVAAELIYLRYREDL